MLNMEMLTKEKEKFIKFIEEIRQNIFLLKILDLNYKILNLNLI